MKKIIIIFILACLSLSLSAQTFYLSEISSDPKNLSLAASSLARPATGYAIEQNAAAMSFSSERSVASLSYGKWAPKMSNTSIYSGAAFVRMGEKFSIGLLGKYSNDEPYLVYDNNGKVVGKFSPNEIAAGLGFSYLILDKLSLGAAIKFYNSSIAEGLKYSSAGLDLNAMYSDGSFSAAISAQNLFAKNLATLLKAGASYSLSFLTASAQVDYWSKSFGAAAGLEANILDFAFLRAGYHYGSKAPSYASLGAGVKFAFLELNAAYLLSATPVGNSLLVGLSLAF